MNFEQWIKTQPDFCSLPYGALGSLKRAFYAGMSDSNRVGAGTFDRPQNCEIWVETSRCGTILYHGFNDDLADHIYEISNSYGLQDLRKALDKICPIPQTEIPQFIEFLKRTPIRRLPLNADPEYVKHYLSALFIAYNKDLRSK